MGSRDATTDARVSPGSDAAWRNESVCRTHPTRWWFTGDHGEALLARSICAGCPVKGPCLEFALSRPDLFGIWAATSASERTAIRRVARSDDAAPVTAPSPAPVVEVARQRVRASLLMTVRPDRSVDLLADESDLLTPAEAARKLGVTPNTVTRWSRAGKISAIQTVGGHRRFRRGEIDRVLRADVVVATAV